MSVKLALHALVLAAVLLGIAADRGAARAAAGHLGWIAVRRVAVLLMMVCVALALLLVW